jgi:hypothetical protein
LNHFAASKFWDHYSALPKDVQSAADAAFQRLKADPSHPSLHFKRVGRFWSARVGLAYRALAVHSDDDLVWFWIGQHGEYDRLVR